MTEINERLAYIMQGSTGTPLKLEGKLTQVAFNSRLSSIFKAYFFFIR